MTCQQPTKQRHRSFRAAIKARDALEAERGIDVALRPYRCEDHWHLGHKGQKNPKVLLAKALGQGRAKSRNARRSRKR